MKKTGTSPLINIRQRKSLGFFGPFFTLLYIYQLGLTNVFINKVKIVQIYSYLWEHYGIAGVQGLLVFSPHWDLLLIFVPSPRPEQGVPKSGEGFIDFIGQVQLFLLCLSTDSLSAGSQDKRTVWPGGSHLRTLQVMRDSRRIGKRHKYEKGGQ